MGPRWRAAALAAALPGAFLPAGCAGALSRWDVAPSGLPTAEDELRRELADGGALRALERLGPDGEVDPGDDLLALMYEGLVAYHAGRFHRSSDALVRAEYVAADRYTKSVSRALLSLLAGDRVLAYDPGPTERLFLHYYDALSWLRLGDRDEAAVAARRLVHLLNLYSDRPADERERRVRGLLRLFAGAVFEAAGEPDDAAVAYAAAAREGAALPPGTGGPDATQLASASAGAGAGGAPAGDVLLVVEKGFVAHRAERALHLLLWPHELDAFRSAGASARLDLSNCLAERLLGVRVEGDTVAAGPPLDVPGRLARPDPLDPATRERCVPVPAPRAAATRRDRRPPADGDAPAGAKDTDDAERARNRVPSLVRIAWPVYRRGGGVTAPVRVVLAGGEVDAAGPSASLSDAVIAEFESGAATRFVTTLARTAIKYGIARSLEAEAREEDETLGDVVGILADAGAALLERADTRAWHLLPDEVSLVRIRLPAGVHDLTLRIGEGPGRRIRVPVVVRAGALEVVSARVWRDEGAVGHASARR